MATIANLGTTCASHCAVLHGAAPPTDMHYTAPVKAQATHSISNCPPSTPPAKHRQQAYLWWWPWQCMACAVCSHCCCPHSCCCLACCLLLQGQLAHLRDVDAHILQGQRQQQHQVEAGAEATAAPSRSSDGESMPGSQQFHQQPSNSGRCWKRVADSL